MNRRKIWLILLTLLLLIPIKVEAALIDADGILVEASFEKGIGQRNIGNSTKTNVCYSSGCRNPKNTALKLTVEYNGKTVYYKSNPVSKNQTGHLIINGIEYGTITVGDIFITNITVNIHPEDLSAFLNNSTDSNIQENILNAKKSAFYKLLCDAYSKMGIGACKSINSINKNSQMYASDATEALNEFAKYANNTYVIVEPEATITKGSLDWWDGNTYLYDDQVKYIGLDGTVHTLDRSSILADKNLITCDTKASDCLGVDYAPMWKFLNAYTNNNINAYNFFMNQWNAYLGCSGCDDPLNHMTSTDIEVEKARRIEKMNSTYADAIAKYNHYVKFAKNLSTTYTPPASSKTLKEIAADYLNLTCHEAGYKNGNGTVGNGNCSAPVSGSASSHLSEIYNLLYMDKTVGKYGTNTQCSSASWKCIADRQSRLGLNVFKVEIKTFKSKNGMCRYNSKTNTLEQYNSTTETYEPDTKYACCDFETNGNSNWYTFDEYKSFTATSLYKSKCTTCSFDPNTQTLTVKEGYTKKDCCEYTKNGVSLWKDEKSYKTFAQSGNSAYRELECEPNKNKCVFNGKDTYRWQTTENLDCCLTSNYESDPSKLTGWNDWYSNTCKTYACTLNDLKNIKSASDSKINCCYSISEYSAKDKNTINSRGGLENYIKHEAQNNSDYKTVLGICYPSVSCIVEAITLCPTCSVGNSDGTIADYVNYKTENSSIITLNYDNEAIKSCVINNSSLLSFSNSYCKAYCGEQIEYDYPTYANTTVLAGTKITVGKNGTFSPITLIGTKKCFVANINSDLFINQIKDVNERIVAKAAEIEKYYKQIKSVSNYTHPSDSCDYKYGSCGGESHCRVCSNMFSADYCQSIYNQGVANSKTCYDEMKDIQTECNAACQADRTNIVLCNNCDKITDNCDTLLTQAQNAYSACSSAMKCDVPDSSRYEAYDYNNYVTENGRKSTFCENRDPRSGWEKTYSQLKEDYKRLLQERNGYIKSMNDCMNIQTSIGYSEFSPSLSLDYSSGIYSNSDITLDSDISTSSTGSIGTGTGTIDYTICDLEKGTCNSKGTATYAILKETDSSNHEFTITKIANFYLGNNFNNYTYVDLKSGESYNSSIGSTMKSAINIGPHLPIQYNSKEASINTVKIKTDTFGSGNKFNAVLSSNNQCKNYECSFNVYNKLMDSKGLKVVYRPISLSNPFPEEDGKGRLTGANWCSNNDCSNTNNTVKKVITNNRGASEDELYGLTPLYTIVLKPKDILSIRTYNLINKYGDFTLECKQSSTEYKCYSTFLDDLENKGIIDIYNSCALGHGNYCQDNGKDVY